MKSEDVEQAAAGWFARRQSSLWTAADQAAFNDWLNAATAHRIAYVRLDAAWQQAARLKVGSEARITIDSEPNQSAAARVSFVSPEAQFTPKQVETRSEREKLMFRVKLQVPAELVQHYVERIKTGMRGVGYVKLTDDAKWPDWLERGLVNPPKGGATLNNGQPW